MAVGARGPLGGQVVMADCYRECLCLLCWVLVRVVVRVRMEGLLGGWGSWNGMDIVMGLWWSWG